MIKKLIVLIGLAISLNAFGQNNSVSENLFKGNELGISVGSGYVLDTSAPFQEKYAANISVGASYFLTRNLGLEAWVPLWSSKGVSVSEVQAGALFRLPLSKETKYLRNVAPYLGIGGAANWHTDSTWSYIGKAGVEARINAGWSLFFEGQYRNHSLDNWGDGQVSLFGGLKLLL